MSDNIVLQRDYKMPFGFTMRLTARAGSRLIEPDFKPTCPKFESKRAVRKFARAVMEAGTAFQSDLASMGFAVAFVRHNDGEVLSVSIAQPGTRTAH